MKGKTIKDILISNVPSKEGDITAFNTIVHIVNGTPMDCLAKSYKYILQLEQKNKMLRENAEHNDKVVDKVNQENRLLEEKNEFLMKRDNRCQMLEQVIKKIKDYLEYYLIDNLKYEESQKEFKRLLDFLKEVE